MDWTKKQKNFIQNKRLHIETHTQSSQSKQLVQKNLKLVRKSNI